MIHEDKFAPVGVGFFYRWEFSFLRTENFRFGFSASGGYVNEERANKRRQKPDQEQRTGNEEKADFHGSIFKLRMGTMASSLAMWLLWV